MAHLLEEPRRFRTRAPLRVGVYWRSWGRRSLVAVSEEDSGWSLGELRLRRGPPLLPRYLLSATAARDDHGRNGLAAILGMQR